MSDNNYFILNYIFSYDISTNTINNILYVDISSVVSNFFIKTPNNNIIEFDYSLYNNTKYSIQNSPENSNYKRLQLDTYKSSSFYNIRLQAGEWKFSINNSFLNETTATKILPYRDFLYNNEAPIVSRNEISLQDLSFKIEKDELLNFRNNNKFYYNSLGVDKINASNKKGITKTFFEFVSWFPNNEINSDPTNQNAWSLPNDYQGSRDIRIREIPSYYTTNYSETLLYKNLSTFNEPGYRYNNKSFSSKTTTGKDFFVNKVSLLGITQESVDGKEILDFLENISKQHYFYRAIYENGDYLLLDTNLNGQINIPSKLIEQTQDCSLNFIPYSYIINESNYNGDTNIREQQENIMINNLTKKKSSSSNFDSIDNWEVELYIPEKKEDGTDLIINELPRHGFFTFGTYEEIPGTSDFSNNMIIGICENGSLVLPNGVTESSPDISGIYRSYIFRDISGNPHHANLFEYGVQIYTESNQQQNTYNPTQYKGGFSIRYVFRKNSVNHYDVYIFINNIFCKKINNGGCNLNSINYFGVPQKEYFFNSEMVNEASMGIVTRDVNTNLMVVKVFESIKTSHIDCVFRNKNIVTWDKYIPIFNKQIQLDNNYNNLTTIETYGDNVSTEKYPIYFTDNSGSYGNYQDISRAIIFDLQTTNSVPNNAYLTIEDFNFEYSIEDISSDKLHFEVSNDGINWLIPGIDIDISGGEWFYKEKTRPALVDHLIATTPVNQTYNSSFPVRFYDDGGEVNNYTEDYSANIVFNLSNITNNTNKKKYIIVHDLSFGHHLTNPLGHDNLQIETSTGTDVNNDSAFSGISENWMFQYNLEFPTIVNNLNLTNLTTSLQSFEQDNSYGRIYIDSDNISSDNVLLTNNNYIVKTQDVSNGILFYSDSNSLSNSTNISFKSNNNKKLSFKILAIELQNSSNIIVVSGKNNSVDPYVDISFNFEPQKETFIHIDIEPGSIVNTNFNFLQFNLNISQNNPSFAIFIYETENELFKRYNGNVLPRELTEKKIITIPKEVNLIKFKFEQDISTNYFSNEVHKGWKIDIFLEELYGLQDFSGNYFPENPKKALEIYDTLGFKKSNFNEINKIYIPYRYIKFLFTTNSESTNSGWKIRIDNKNIQDLFTKVEFKDDSTVIPVFNENSSSNNYPVHFSHTYLNNNNNSFEENKEYSYLFDAGENNTINLEFVDFSFNKQSNLITINNGDVSNNQSALFQRMSISLSNDNINWYPANISWCYRTNNYIGNTSGSNKINNYSTYYNSEDILLSRFQNQHPSWYITDISGFVLPQNKNVAIAKYKLEETVETSVNSMSSIEKDNLWKLLNKYYTNFRYCKFILKMEHSDIQTNFPEWNINIYINHDVGAQFGIISNKNNLNVNTKSFQTESISVIHSLTGNEIFQNSVGFSKNDFQVPYISKYDYIIKDFSNNIFLSSQIDTDVIFNESNTNYYNNNGKREGIEYNLLENRIPNNSLLTSNVSTKNIQQKYNYSSKFLNQINQNELPYIPEQGTILFSSALNKAYITIPSESIKKIRRSLVEFWKADNYITYVKFVLYVWNPWSNKFTNYYGNQAEVNNELKLKLIETEADNVIEINVEDTVYKTFSVPGIPLNTTFTVDINEYTGRYIFIWTYKVFQDNGVYNNITPAEYIYSTNINNAYIPNSTILDLKDYLKDDYIYDPSNIIIKRNTNVVSGDIVQQESFTIKFSEKEILDLYEYFNLYQSGLLKQYIFLDNIVIRLYLWTPNNEITYNPVGWVLPNDYYGKNDVRIKQTPFYFDEDNLLVQNRLWDPFTDNNGERFFGYNIFSDGVVIKTNNSLKQDLSGNLLISKEKIRNITFNITTGENGDIYHNPLDQNRDVTKLPDTNNYIKNGNKIPYISRWELTFNRDESFMKSESISFPTYGKDISLNSTYNITEDVRIYNDISGSHGGYPMIFRSKNISEDLNKETYENNVERQIIFDAGENNNICLEINKFNFFHEMNVLENNDIDISANDRLALLVGDTSENFVPINIRHLYQPNNLVVVNSTDIDGNNISVNTYPSYNLGLTGVDLDNSGVELVFINNEINNINRDYSGGYIFPQNILMSKYIRGIENVNNIQNKVNNLSNYNVDISSVRYLNTNKRFVKFRFYSKDNASERNNYLNQLPDNNKYLGWNFKIYNTPNDSFKQISSNVIYQRGDLGNSSTDFNFLFSFSDEYCLELDKSVKEIYPDLTLFKNFKDTGITLGFNADKTFLIIRNNGLLWQFVIKLPPEGYVFDELDESGNKIGELNPVTNQDIITSNLSNLKFTGSLNTQLLINNLELSFDQTGESTTIDNGRKYIVYIRKATPRERIFFSKFQKSTIIQFETTEILSRLSDWYPFNVNYENSSNYYNYGTYFMEDEEKSQETVSNETKAKEKDSCGLCRPITKTKEINTYKQRYSRTVSIDFRNAARLRGNICN